MTCTAIPYDPPGGSQDVSITFPHFFFSEKKNLVIFFGESHWVRKNLETEVEVI